MTREARRTQLFVEQSAPTSGPSSRFNAIYSRGGRTYCGFPAQRKFPTGSAEEVPRHEDAIYPVARQPVALPSPLCAAAVSRRTATEGTRGGSGGQAGRTAEPRKGNGTGIAVEYRNIFPPGVQRGLCWDSRNGQGSRQGRLYRID